MFIEKAIKNNDRPLMKHRSVVVKKQNRNENVTEIYATIIISS